MATLQVITPGLCTTIQDQGRWGHQASGVSVAGPMDPLAHRLANALVGNGVDAAALEITLTGPLLEFEDERRVVVTGAEFELWLDDRRVPMNEVFVAGVGGRLRFGARTSGARAYLAVEGGIEVTPVLGSRATHVITAMGGLDGRPLAKGARLPLGARGSGRAAVATRETPAIPIPIGQATVRVVPGPNQDCFTSGALDVLQSAAFRIDPDSDRMGYRLTGPSLSGVRVSEIISDATPLGAVQIPASGHPVLLMADRQTTGGYPKLATVISADIGLAGQLAPGDFITFRVCSAHEALAALIAQERVLLAASS